MNSESVIPLVAGLVALAIAIVLTKMYAQRRRIYHLFWAIGMLLWAISDFTQFYALAASWNVPIYLIYFFTSVMLAGFLGSGTVFLVFPKSRFTLWYAWFNIIAALVLGISLVVTPLRASALQNAVTGANPITSSIVEVLAAIVNIPALFTFAGGALYSFVKTRKAYALLIFLGATIPAFGGTLATVAIPQLLPFTDLIGVSVLGAGFYLSFKIRRHADVKSNA